MKEAIRNFIIDKAKTSFEKKGFKDTTIDDIAKASSISIPTLYNYFSGKKDIIIEVVRSIESQLDTKIAPIFKSEMEYFGKIEKLFEVLLEFVKENKEIVKIAFFDSEALSNIYKCDKGELLKSREDRFSKLVLYLEHGKKEGIINSDIDSVNISLFIMGIMHELFFKIIFKKEEINSKKMTDDFTKILKNGILQK